MTPVVIDTREPYEYDSGHADGAINISPMQFMSGEFENMLSGTAKDAPIILYCRTGARSNTCGMMLQNTGYTNVKNGINQHHTAKILNGLDN